MSHGFDLRFFGPHNGSPQVHFDRFEDGVERAYQFLRNSGKSGHDEFAITLSSSDRGSITPTLNLERKPEIGVLAQVFVPEPISPAGEEGWYNLIEPKYRDQIGNEVVSTVWDGGDKGDMVETNLSQGVLFSRHLYVPEDMALDALKFYLESRNLGEMLEQKPWKFLGLI